MTDQPSAAAYNPVTNAGFDAILARRLGEENLRLQTRAERAEIAALGAIQALQPLVAAVDALFKSAGSDDHGTYADAVEGLRTAHNGALDWVREEARRVGK